MKKIVSILAALSLLSASAATAADFTCTQVYYPIYFDGTLLPTDDLPVLNLNGSTYVPLRKISEGSGLSVFWNNENQSVHISNPIVGLMRDAALGLDLMYLFRETEDKVGDCIDSILAAVRYYSAPSGITNNNLTNIRWITDTYDTLDNKLQKLENTLNAIKYGSDIKYDAFLALINCDPDAMYASLVQSRQNLEQIKNAAIGYLNGNFTYQYYYNTYNAYYESARESFWNTYGESINEALETCYSAVSPKN